MIKRIRIGTRNSPLALWQANFIKNEIERHFPEIHLSLIHIKTRGDIDQESSLTKVGGQGIFTKTIEKSLLDNQIDFAVHSLKDLPTEMPDPLVVKAVPKRGSIFDVLIGTVECDYRKLPKGAIIACGSIRRRAQLLALRPDIQFVDLRGNIETRLTKLRQNQYNGIIMAEAAIIRLNLKDIDYYRFSIDEMLPAVSQGAIGVQIRKDDPSLVTVLEKVNHPETYFCVTAERAFLNRLDSGCQFPVAAYAEIKEDRMTIDGLVASNNGRIMLKDSEHGDSHLAEQLGFRLAEKLIAQGALDLLSED
jgi:hydroxymethylbilane synthase